MFGYRLTLALVLTSALAAILAPRLTEKQDSSGQIAALKSAAASSCPTGNCDG